MGQSCDLVRRTFLALPEDWACDAAHGGVEQDGRRLLLEMIDQTLECALQLEVTVDFTLGVPLATPAHDLAQV